jgi:4-amino-4-deoxy-L-arabinose transferase-like glycosyltransferase
MFRLWGVNEVSSSLYILISSILLIFLTYRIAGHFLGKEGGYIAALLQAVYPMDVLSSTALYPDIPTALFVGLGIYLFYRGAHGKGKRYLLASGLMVGIAYTVKMTGLFSVPLIMGYAIYMMVKEKRIKWSYSWTLLGFMAIFAAELIFFHISKGDMLYRFHSLSVHNQGPWSGLPLYLKRGYTARLLYQYPMVMLFYLPHFGLFYWFTFAAAGYLLAVKDKKGRFPMVWWLVLFLMLNFGSTSLSRYIPLPPVSRYSFILLLPANIVLACALVKLTAGVDFRKWARTIGYSALMVLILSSIYIVVKERARGSYTERAISAYFNGKPDKPIYTDSRTTAVLEYYFGYRNLDLLRNFEGVHLESVRASYVVVNLPRLRFLNKYYGKLFDPILFKPPPTWKRVAIFSPDRGPYGKPYLTRRGAVIYSIDENE